MPERAGAAASRPSYVVAGGSAGGLAALGQILRDFPEDLPCALLVVIHVSETSSNTMAERLDRLGSLPVELARDGARIRQGFAYVAPAGSHLIVRGERLALDHGARVNFSRPSIDVLFRSAAEAFGRRTIGLILSGMLADGTDGLRAVRDAGGITIVQNPEGAEEGEMPRNAMRDLGVDYCLDLGEIGPLLELLVRRAGRFKRGMLETGLASSLRLLKDRARLFDKLVKQSRGNPRTETFLKAEVTALDRDIARIQRMVDRAAAALRRKRGGEGQS
jgi:two-component system chemotaxis response regulator CheB